MLSYAITFYLSPLSREFWDSSVWQALLRKSQGSSIVFLVLFVVSLIAGRLPPV
jgi:hypothetical protein